MNKLDSLIQEIESHIDSCSILNSKVSSVPIAWHLYHTLLVIRNVSEFLLKSNPKEFKSNFNFLKSFVFLLGKIPRGRGKAPKAVDQKEEIKKVQIIDLLQEVKTILQSHTSLDRLAFFNHPYFGSLNKKDTLKFLYLHTEHHLKIVREIRKK